MQCPTSCCTAAFSPATASAVFATAAARSSWGGRRREKRSRVNHRETHHSSVSVMRLELLHPWDVGKCRSTRPQQRGRF